MSRVRAVPGVRPGSEADLARPRPGPLWAPQRGTASDTAGARGRERRTCSSPERLAREKRAREDARRAARRSALPNLTELEPWQIREAGE